jgi:lipopolysaccharide/colanic/teichoic acid biosynthesis glycosyltransferase
MRKNINYKKPLVDWLIAMSLLIVFWPVFLLTIFLSAWDTHSNGVFVQIRIGQMGRAFYIYKLRTYHKKTNQVSRLGFFFRKYKIDEWPQLLNVIIGNMSLVGPRPDVPGYADKLQGIDRDILSVKPGITGLASLKYRDEERLLLNQYDPLYYNNRVIYPDKVRLNLLYIKNQSWCLDLKIIYCTITDKTFWD